MKINRRFTDGKRDVFSTIEWTTRTSKIHNSDGSVVFEMNDAEIPKEWSQLATDIVVSKYFRKAGVPQFDQDGVPVVKDGKPVFGPEKSVRQVVHRLAGCWAHWGQEHGYFDSADDAQAFYDELSYMLITQMAAPNSPQWFNTGLNWAYGINSPAQGHWIADHLTGSLSLAKDAYTHPQPHACFIQSVSDDLVNEGGIMDLWVREARLFKYGSGTGTNFSRLRGENEPLSGGGRSSGLMSFLKIGDRAAGAIKSGGTTRRAAKMVCLDVDHPDIEAFVNWKVREELKVAALVEGMKHLPKDQQDLAKGMGLKLDYDFNGEAYYTVSGQNSNNSVRLSDAFFDAVDADADWSLTRRMDGKAAKTLKASALWDQICYAAWRCADPGLQYDTTINAWHTCPEGGRINASNPCSEYMFLDNTACNLASINLMKFYDAESKAFDIAGFEHAIDVWTMVLEISVLMASFPSREIAELSWKYRTLGLGYANLGAMLMQAGIPYDSDEGRAICGAITSIMTGRSYAASARMAAEHGAFAGYEENREHMLRVMRNHRAAAHGAARDSGAYDQLRIPPVPIDHALFRSGRINVTNAEAMLAASTAAWDQALELGTEYGFRNAQVTVIAPTGTIGLLMDCDTTGVEPDFALTKFKKLAGGGYFKIANQSLRPALRSLGYTNAQTDDILTYVMGTLSLDVPMADERGTISASQPSFRSFLIEAGFTNEELITLENGLPSCFEIGFAFSAWSMPERVLRKAGVDADRAKADMGFNGLRALGLNRRQIDALNRVICGTGTIEGAPRLKDAHLPVFDCANKCGTIGKRFIAAEGHIRMMAAAQPFISGAISKTINLPNEASVDEIGKAYRLSWELGLKANALYRDGCKLSQPLATKSDTATSDAADHAEEADLDGLPDEAKVPAADGQPQIIERVVERIVERVIERPSRRRLSDTRQSITHKFNVAGHEGYLVVGLYEDGMPGELFITMAKEGSTIGGLMDSLGTAISVALQYGVPLQSLVNKFAHQRFEPMGMTQNRDIPIAKSLVDYIFRWMGMEFIQGYREQNAPHRPGMDAGSHAPAVAGGARDHVKEDSWNDRTAASHASRASSHTASGDLTLGDRISGIHGASDSSECCDGDSGSCKHAAAPAGSVTSSTGAKVMTNALDAQAASAMGDAPPCSVCGAITVRNGTCYRCFNCGASQGCS